MAEFNFCGKISLPKQSEKFNPIDRRDFRSGWTNTTVKFNCLSGANRVLCMVQGGKWLNDKKNVIKTFSKTVRDENGNLIKGEKIEISWAKRFDEDQIDKVAGHKKFVCDTGDAKMRYKLQDLVNAFENKTATDEMIEQVGIDNLEDAKEALEKSIAKKRVFLSEWDFAEHIAKVASSDKYKNKMFYIKGNYDIQYNEEKQVFYTNYHVNKIYLAPDDAEPETTLNVDFYFGEDAWNDDGYEDTGKCYINGWTNYYDSNVKRTGFKPIVVAVKEDEKKTAAFKRKFNVEDGIKQIGLILRVIDGADRQEITMEMLDDETREDIEAGLLDFESVKREMGGNVVGSRISELRFVKLAPKKNTVQDTVYTVEDMCPAKASVESAEDIVEDIFEDDDDL